MWDVMAFMSHHFMLESVQIWWNEKNKNIASENAFDILVDKMSDFSLTPPYVKLQ